MCHGTSLARLVVEPGRAAPARRRSRGGARRRRTRELAAVPACGTAGGCSGSTPQIPLAAVVRDGGAPRSARRRSPACRRGAARASGLDRAQHALRAWPASRSPTRRPRRGSRSRSPGGCALFAISPIALAPNGPSTDGFSRITLSSSGRSCSAGAEVGAELAAAVLDRRVVRVALLEQPEPEAHDRAALDLPLDQRRVDRAADVVDLDQLLHRRPRRSRRRPRRRPRTPRTRSPNAARSRPGRRRRRPRRTASAPFAEPLISSP